MSKNTLLSELINYVSANSSGNVTVAAPTSGVALTVNGAGNFIGPLNGMDATFTGQVIATSTGFPQPSLILKGNFDFGTIQFGNTANYNITAGTDLVGMEFKVGGSQKMLIVDNGNVGINNSNPTVKLDVIGTGRFTGQLSLGSTITNGTFTYTLPGATGTLALTSALASYLPLAGGTLTGALSGTSATFNHNDAPTIRVQRNGGTDSNTVVEFTNASRSFFIGSNGTVMGLGGTSGAIGSQPLQIASTGAATFSSSVTQLGEGYLISNAGTPNMQLRKSGVTDWGNIQYDGSRVTIGTFNGGQTLNVTTGGMVGIGTTAPDAPLEVRTGTGGNLRVRLNGSNNLLLQNYIGSEGYRNMQFAASTVQFLTGTEAGDSATERMRITSGGQIVMGRTSPSGSGRLTVDGDLYLHNISAGAGQSTLKYNYTSTGLVTYDTSSRLLKKDIQDLPYGLGDILKMSSKKYNWKRDNSVDLGFIADEMFEIIPEIVFFSNENTERTTGVPSGQPLSINYDRLIPILVKGIQELKAELDTLKNR
jgi:hypothetical protein